MRDNFGADRMKTVEDGTLPVADVAGDEPHYMDIEVPTWDDAEAVANGTATETITPFEPVTDEDMVAAMAHMLRNARSAYSKMEGLDETESGDWTDFYARFIVEALNKG